MIQNLSKAELRFLYFALPLIVLYLCVKFQPSPSYTYGQKNIYKKGT